MKKFTLIELLIVVAVIALLMSILLPSLSRARESAMLAVCMSQLKQVGVGFGLYAKNNKGYFPPAATDGSPGAAYIGKISYDDQLAAYMGRKLTAAQINQSFLTHAQAGDKIFLCPKDKTPPDNGDHIRRSYSMNGGSWWMYSAYRGVGNEQGYSCTLGQIANVSSTIAAGERINKANRLGSGNFGVLGNASWGHLGQGIHKGMSDKFTFVMADGHVEYLDKADAAQKQDRF